MAADAKRARLGYLRAFAWILIWGQLLAVFASTSGNWIRRYRLQSRLAEARRFVREAALNGDPLNPALRVGLRVAAVPVETAAGQQIDLLRAAKRCQGLLFVSSCAACTAGLIDQYDRLYRSGLDVKVIARIPGRQILTARQKYGWRIPCYSDTDHPRAAQECRVIFRPAGLVVDKGGRVVYVQGVTDDRESALAKIGRILRARAG